MTVGVPLNGLGMSEQEMLELVNRLNKYDDRKWILTRAHGYGSMRNAAMDLDLHGYQSQLANNAVCSTTSYQ